MNKHKGFTLTEVLIAVTLTGLVILAITSVDITSRQFFGDIKEQIQVQDETNIAMEQMVKNVQLGIGDITSPGVAEGVTPSPYSEQILMIRRDYNNPLTPSDYSDDIWIGYALDAREGHEGELFFCPNTAYDHRAGEDGGESRHEIIGNRVTTFTFSIADNTVSLTITARNDPSEAEGPENPETTLTSSAVLRAMSCK